MTKNLLPVYAVATSSCIDTVHRKVKIGNILNYVPKRSLKTYWVESLHKIYGSSSGSAIIYGVSRRGHQLYVAPRRGSQIICGITSGSPIIWWYRSCHSITNQQYLHIITTAQNVITFFPHMYRNITIPVHNTHIYSSSLAAKTHNFEVRFTPIFFSNHASVNAWIEVSDWQEAQNLMHGYCMIVVCSKPRTWLPENYWSVRYGWLARVTKGSWCKEDFQQWITNPFMIFSFKILNLFSDYTSCSVIGAS
jgi:hypothetical protein